jgi:hypothetical protein
MARKINHVGMTGLRQHISRGARLSEHVLP